MTEWWAVLAVFWALYLLDGLRGGRRERLVFHGLAARRRAHGRQTSWSWTPPVPSSWTLATDDLPGSLAPHGLTNWPSGSASRPPPLPDSVASWRWERIQRVEARGAWIWIDGVRFARAAADLDANALRALTARLAPLSLDARAALLRQWHEHRFRPAHLRRRVRGAWHHTRALATLNGVQTVVLLGLSAYLAGGGAELLPSRWQPHAAAGLVYLLSGYAVSHLLAVGLMVRARRRILRQRGAAGAGDAFTALLVPAQALRLRRHLMESLAADQHPVAVALAIGDHVTQAELLRATLADLRWPRRPEGLPREVAQLADEAAKLIEPVLYAAIQRVGAAVEVDRLLAPPPALNRDVCAWCPRCGDQFVRADAHCPHGVPLQRLDGPSRQG